MGYNEYVQFTSKPCLLLSFLLCAIQQHSSCGYLLSHTTLYSYVCEDKTYHWKRKTSGLLNTKKLTILSSSYKASVVVLGMLKPYMLGDNAMFTCWTYFDVWKPLSACSRAAGCIEYLVKFMLQVVKYKHHMIFWDSKIISCCKQCIVPLM